MISGTSRTFVFSDTEIYTNSTRDDEQTKAYKTTAQDAVTQVKSISASLKIPSSLVYFSPPTFESVRDAVLKIRKEHPDARFSFNLSASSKGLSMALFSISLWLEGDTYYAFGDGKGDGTTTKLPVPTTPARDIWSNQNYIRILSLLYRNPGDPKPAPRVLPRSYLFTQLETFYVPVRKKGVRTADNKTGKTDLNTGKRAVIPRLSQGTFTDILSTMKALDLIREEPGQGNNKKEKFYQITPAGELALQLFEIKPRKP